MVPGERRAGEPLSTIQISDNSVHFAVKIKDRVYDAMTGPTGLAVTEYLERQKSPGQLSMQVVRELR